VPVLDEILALELVEQGAPLAPLDRAVLLTVALAGVAPADAPELPLDRRDRLLIDARMAAFGSPLGFFARCPHCGEGSEGVFDLGVLPPATTQDEIVADVGGQPMALRAPTSADVARTVLAGDPALLLERCRPGPATARKRPSMTEVEEALGQAFPLLDIRFDLTCGACEMAFDTRFDIVAWLWREIEGLARRAIDTVDRLARAYGWTEAEILALSPRRRALYLAKTAG
jgi:hypothetical protein